MQNLPEIEFNKFILQNLLKYVPDHLVNKTPRESAPSSTSMSALSTLFWNTRKPGLVKKLWPVTVLIGLCEVLIGLCLLIYIGLYTRDYDSLFNTEDSCLISNLTAFGCVYLMVTAFVLLFALMLESQKPIRTHIFMSVFICVYIFVLACIKIHLSLLVVERDAYKIIDQAAKHSVLLSIGCIVGITTLLGSVAHFIATVTVFTYYNLKYQPTS